MEQKKCKECQCIIEQEKELCQKCEAVEKLIKNGVNYVNMLYGSEIY